MNERKASQVINIARIAQFEATRQVESMGISPKYVNTIAAEVARRTARRPENKELTNMRNNDIREAIRKTMGSEWENILRERGIK